MESALPLLQADVATQADAIPAARRRWLALDLLRFAAVMLMVQGHLFFVVIEDAVREQRWYGYHGYVHGFTAPLFLFASGAAFGITTLNKWPDHTRWGKPIIKRFERYLTIIGIGYVIHFSTLKLSWLVGMEGERFERLTRVDALQHIGVTLLIIEALALGLKRRKLFLGVVASLGVLAVAIAPWAWGWPLEGWPAPIAAYINTTTHSIFPLAPWAGFIVLGLMTSCFVQWRRTNAPQGLMQLAIPLAAFGGALIFAGDQLAHCGWEPFPEHNFWKASPWFFMVRAGVVLSVLAALCALDVALKNKQKAPTVRFVQVVGSQTLVIYVIHLMVIYGTGVSRGLGSRWSHDLSVGEASLLAGGLFVAMGLLAWVWDRTKRGYPIAFDRVRYAVTVAVVLAFVLR